MIAAGGTGGHIYPALALADLLKSEGIRVTFCGSSDRLESELIPAKGYPLIELDIKTTRGGIAGKVRYGISLLKSIHYCRSMIREQKPDICVGFGNYISVPLILAAHDLRVKTMISEQNSFAGKANVFLGKYCDAVELAYENSLRDFKKEKCRVLGNPQASAAAVKEADPSILEAYGLDRDKPLVTVMTGSLGSQSVSEMIDRACDQLEGIQVLIAAGKKNPYHFVTENRNVRVADYVDGVAMLKLSDLAVCRSGATTLAEIAVTGTPSILIPSPYVPNNHQYFNARELADVGAAVLIEEKDLTPEKLAAEITRLVSDRNLLASMGEGAKTIGKPNAARDMINWMKELCDA